ncbi:MAG TPA: DUF484 family protein [Burkholderiaceae bacterium]|jgi:uncharacterized protein YigA (DUF484 family)|nr:DUF484 family protein [Burkholderiaceae bacterium]HYJ99593.1 DUF484 family protein [Burkholderiaceae bacterium]
MNLSEAELARYLLDTPGFFERHAEVLAAVRLTSPHGQRAVSLQERQMEMLRDKIKGLEHRIIEMIRHSQENEAIADRLHRFTQAILLTANPGELPEVIVRELKHEFMVPRAALRMWGAADPYTALRFAQGASDDLRSFAASLHAPYCGANSGFEACNWLEEPESVASLAMIPLRHAGTPGAFGLLVLGSPDPTRYSADMGTEFLARLGETASAGLSRLLPAF